MRLNKRGRDDEEGDGEANDIKRAKMLEQMKSFSASGAGGNFDLNALLANAIGVPKADEPAAGESADPSSSVSHDYDEAALFGEVEDEPPTETNPLATSEGATETVQETATESMDVDSI